MSRNLQGASSNGRTLKTGSIVRIVAVPPDVTALARPLIGGDAHIVYIEPEFVA